MRYTPHPYQQYATNRIIEQPTTGLFIGMGLGKTVITLTAIQELKYGYFEPIKKVLVVAPLRVAHSTWTKEQQKWDHLRGLTISKVLGESPAERVNGLMEKVDIYIINRENLVWLVELYKRKWPFDMVVIDEFSSFKSQSSERFKALRKVRPLIKRLVGLTGTPAPNGLLDLWPQVYLLDQGKRLYDTFGAYRTRYFQPTRKMSLTRKGHKFYSWVWGLVDGADRLIYDKISDICISMSSKDWLTLPERIDNEITVPLTKEEYATYRRFEKERILEFFETGNVVTAGSAGILTNKLLQLANGAIYDDEKNVHVLHSAKLDRLGEIIEDANGSPILVFYWFRHDRERIMKRFKVRELKSVKDEDDWNNGDIPVLIAHPESCGHGLNLQSGGHIIVWFSLCWSLEYYMQANARLDRQGQKEAVIVHHLIAEGTIDEDVIKVLRKKEATQNELLEAVKAKIVERWSSY